MTRMWVNNISDITKGVQGCRAFVTIVSTTYGCEHRSKYTYKEYLLAEKRGKIIVPVYHSGIFPPPSLSMDMVTMQFVPKAGAISSNKVPIAQVGAASAAVVQ